MSARTAAGLSFSLSTAFAKTDLDRFYASGTNIVLAKPAGGGSPNVAWIVYRPLISNTIQWEENYGIYASNAEIQNGAQLVQISATGFPAVADKQYTMAPSGNVIGGTSSSGTTGSYVMDNQYNNLPKGMLTFGLFQAANVDGVDILGNAVSAAPVIYQSNAVMTPFTTVYLWTQSQVKSNTVVTTVTSAQTKVTFGGSITSVALQYDSSTGTFIPAASEKRISLDHGLDHLMPRL